MTWQEEFPLTKRLEQVWEGCGWAEGLEPGIIDEPLGRAPTMESLDEWRKDTLERRKRYWRKTEKYFEQNPDEYSRLIRLGELYKERGWLEYV